LRWLSFAYAGHFLAPFEFYFFAGLLGGWVFACLPLRLGGSLGLLIVGLAVLADYVPALRWGYSYGDPMTAPVTGLGFAAIIVGLANLERLGWLRFGATAQRLGAMSYPLYILHTPLILVVDSSFGWLRLGTVGLNMLAVAGFLALYLLIAIVTFALDQPLQRLLRHLSRREKNVSSGPASIEVSI
jgi:peptidoglycan/LPS O-acetylase OafA/YrhL